MTQYRTLYIAVGVWVVLWAVLAAYLPAFPVDETRYLTVAWEMRHSGDWLLPTLNWAPYSHKPPMLFWLINLVWDFTGMSVGAARVIPLLSSLATLALTVVLAKRMFPQQPKAPVFSGLVLMACPAFMIYGIMIMFDFMQAVCVVAAMIAVWDVYTKKEFKSWLIFGLALGLGILAKGPVILVHTMPVVLLFPFFMRGQWTGPSLKQWYGGIGVGFLVALLIGLAWAIPAAIHGGPKFTHMIFWEQSAGRMHQSFAHREPIWFYIPIMIAFTLPLLAWAPVWRGIGRIIEDRRDPAIVFLLCWISPVFIAFSLISGKQPHYLIPMMSGVALLIGRFIAEQDVASIKRWGLTCLLPAVAGFIALAGFRSVHHIHNADAHYLVQGLQAFDMWVICGLLAVIACAVMMGRTLQGQLLSVIVAFAVLLGAAAVQAHEKLVDYYDLQPLATVVAQHNTQPIAFAPEYAGEIGYLARLEKPVTALEPGEVPAWFQKNRNGVLVIRYKTAAEVKAYKSLYTLPYRGSGYISVMQAK